jgi:restriction system protein
MSIPNYQTVMLPLLKLVAKYGQIKMSDVTQLIADEFRLTEEERRELLPSGKQPIIQNRVAWARTYLKKAGLLDSPQRGVIEISDRGKKVLSENPKMIDVIFLRQFPDFLDFRNSSHQEDEASSIVNLSQGTPEEILEESYSQLKSQLFAEMIEKIKSCSPRFFEILVVDTIVKMGYGGSLKDAGRAIGQSGDEGIDGIINEDRLGLDVIYLQAKRWEGNISRPEIQKFAGALQGKRAKKGIFMTTSDFTSEAREFVKQIDAKIILISGKRLAELMWEYGIGLNTTTTYEIKKLDLDYFSE